jgi:predicted metal-dependent hydrolase
MNNREEVKNLVQKLKTQLGITEKVKVRLKPYKGKVASISLTQKVIYLNSNLLDKLTPEELEYVIAHELLHLKYGIFHTEEFEKELKKLFKEDIRLRILKKFVGKF